ncbi:unnamed protein product, partial [Linum tenue]
MSNLIVTEERWGLVLFWCWKEENFLAAAAAKLFRDSLDLKSFPLNSNVGYENQRLAHLLLRTVALPMNFWDFRRDRMSWRISSGNSEIRSSSSSRRSATVGILHCSIPVPPGR